MKDLTKKENWTKEEKYIHKTRLAWGIAIGMILATLIMSIFGK